MGPFLYGLQICQSRPVIPKYLIDMMNKYRHYIVIDVIYLFNND
jgi:hypothetical protein